MRCASFSVYGRGESVADRLIGPLAQEFDMRAAELVLTPDGGSFPGVDRRLASLSTVRREALMSLEWHADGSYALLYRISCGDRGSIVDALDGHADVHRYQLVEADGERYYLFLHVSEREPLSELLTIAERHTLLLEPPFRFTDRGVTITVAGAADALRAAYEEATAVVDVAVEWIGGYEPGGGGVLTRLTDRQREAIEAAREIGYYETPRRVNFEDVASELECAPSTANELLRRAEASLIDAVLESQTE